MAVDQADAITGSVAHSGSKSPGSVCASLKMIVEAARQSLYAPKNPLAKLELNYVKGYVIDDANHDVIIYGNRIDGRPPIYFDDLCVSVQNVWHPDRIRYSGHQYPSPFCSLDPRKGALAAVEQAMRAVGPAALENIVDRRRVIQRLVEALGPQEVRIGGVPRDARMAHVMIDADYHMKKISQGHLSLPGVPSCLRIALDHQQRPAGTFAWLGRLVGRSHSPGNSRMSRFWFRLDKNHPSFVEAGGIVEIRNCAMVVLTERQVSARDGSFVDGGGDDPHARRFAKSLSTHLRNTAAYVTEYADLENLYRLFALLKAIQFAGAETVADLKLSPILSFRPQRIAMPSALPALANIEIENEETLKAKRWWCSVVCGGVSVDVLLAPRSFKTARDRRLALIKTS